MKDGDLKEPCFEFFILLPLAEMAPRRIIYFFYCMHALPNLSSFSFLFSFDVHFSLYSSVHHLLLTYI